MAQKLSRRGGRGPYRIFINKTCPGYERNKLTIHEALAIVLYTGCESIPHVFAAAAGGKFVRDSAPSAPTIMDAILAAVLEHGDLGRAI